MFRKIKSEFECLEGLGQNFNVSKDEAICLKTYGHNCNVSKNTKRNAVFESLKG